MTPLGSDGDPVDHAAAPRRLRKLPASSPFAADDGRCDPALRTALAIDDPAERLEAVVAALAAARVLVPVVAHPRHEGAQVQSIGSRPDSGGGHGASLRRESASPGEESSSPSGESASPGHSASPGSHSHGAVLITVAGPDGRSVLPAFSSVETMSRWRADARPMPVPATRAALAAQAEADGLLVIDPAGPVPVQLPRPATSCLADGRAWLPAARDQAVAAAVARAMAGLAALTGVAVEPGRRAELAVVLRVQDGLDRSGLDELLAAAGRALAAEQLVAERVDSIELRVVSAGGTSAAGGPA